MSISKKIKNYKILMVDDNPENIQLLGSILKESYSRLGFATDGIQALKLLMEAMDYDLVLLDVNIPRLNGYEVCRKMKETPELKEIPVIFLSAYNDVDFIVEGFDAGGTDYVTKPIKKKELLARIDTQLKLRDTIREKDNLLTSEQMLLDNTLRGIIKMLINIVSMVSPIELFPSKKSTQNARKLVQLKKIQNTWELEITLLLSKIGCISIPLEVLDNKINGKDLTDVQHQVFMKHPQLGKKLLSNIPGFEIIAESIAYQFKNFDGSGYPDDTVRGKKIPLFGRILRILNDIDDLNLNGKTQDKNFTTFQTKKNNYDPDLFKLITKEMFVDIEIESEENSDNKLYYKSSKNKRTEYFSIGVDKLENGMILADNVVNKNGFIIIHNKKEITEVIRQSLIHLAKLGSISDNVKVYNP